MSAKILYVTQEMFPYLPASEIATLSRELPQAVQEQGREIRTFMPRYGCINERRNQLHEVIRLSGMNLIIDDTDHQLIIKVASIQAARMQVYFIDNEEYFKRKFVLNDAEGKEFADNDDRAVFFARGVLETVKKLRWTPDIIHCHGWMTAALPILAKKAYHDDPFFENAKIVYSLYDDAYAQEFSPALQQKIKMDGIVESNMDVLKENASYENFSKLAIQYSDAVIQGSEKVNDNLVSFAKNSQKMFLPYQDPQNYVTSYNEFYDQVLGK